VSDGVLADFASVGVSDGVLADFASVGVSDGVLADFASAVETFSSPFALAVLMMPDGIESEGSSSLFWIDSYSPISTSSDAAASDSWLGAGVLFDFEVAVVALTVVKAMLSDAVGSCFAGDWIQFTRNPASSSGLAAIDIATSSWSAGLSAGGYVGARKAACSTAMLMPCNCLLSSPFRRSRE